MNGGTQTIFHSRLTAGGALVDMFADTVNQSILADWTGRHTCHIQNRGTGSVRVGAEEALAASPPLGYFIDAGETFTETLSHDRLFLVAADPEETVTDVYVTVILR